MRAFALWLSLLLVATLVPFGAAQPADDPSLELDADGDGEVTCDDFDRRRDARDAILVYPDLEDALDPDGDGSPCEPEEIDPTPEPGEPDPEETPPPDPDPDPDPTATPAPTPAPTATAVATATPAPTATPNPTATPAPTATPPPTVVVDAQPAATATATAAPAQTLPPTPPPTPAPTVDRLPVCADFSTQRRAQRELDRNPDAATTLDPDGTGVACAETFAEATPTATAPPTPAATPAPTPTPAPPRKAGPVRLPDIDCIDLVYQEVAQAVLARDPADPFNLDPSGDGVACSSLPSRAAAVVELPATGTGPATRERRTAR